MVTGACEYSGENKDCLGILWDGKLLMRALFRGELGVGEREIRGIPESDEDVVGDRQAEGSFVFTVVFAREPWVDRIVYVPSTVVCRYASFYAPPVQQRNRIDMVFCNLQGIRN